MRSVEVKGSTVEEAIDHALNRLNVSRDQVEIEVLDEGNQGFLGLIGRREAKVKAKIRRKKAEFAQEIVQKVVDAIGIEGRVEKLEENDRHVFINVEGSDLGLLIGRHGRTLNTLQYLVNLAANKVSEERKKIILEVGDYRERRREQLRRLARRKARQVQKTGRDYVLEPMSAHERKIVHLALQDWRGVETRSKGQEPFRRVVISPSEG